jgi:serine/threonine protein kinase
MSQLGSLYQPTDFSDLTSIGRGSYGEVFRAYNKKIDTTVILKRIIKPMRNPEKTEKEILREISILNHLKSRCCQGIVCYMDFYEDNQNFYIMMEYLGNYWTLEKYIEQHTKSPYPIDVIIDVIENMKRGLMTIHQAGVAHRDLKPANIMVNPTTHDVKFIDFGFACQYDACYTEEHLGTPLYLAPEHFVYKIPKTLMLWIKADYWSLGVCIVELISGENISDFFSQLYYGDIPADLSALIKVIDEHFSKKGLTLEDLAQMCRGHFPSMVYLRHSVLPLFHVEPMMRSLVIDTNRSLQKPHFEQIKLELVQDSSKICGGLRPP